MVCDMDQTRGWPTPDIDNIAQVILKAQPPAA